MQLCGSSRFRLRFRGANSCCGESGGGGAMPLCFAAAAPTRAARLPLPALLFGVSGGIVGLADDRGELCHNVAVLCVLPPLSDDNSRCVVVVDDATESIECVGELPGAACPGDGDGDVVLLC